jgi:hypothetical protein
VNGKSLVPVFRRLREIFVRRVPPLDRRPAKKKPAAR